MALAIANLTVNNTQTAKPSRKRIFDFGKGELNISGSTMDFLMYISPYVDLDGRINKPLSDICEALNMQGNTLNLVLREAQLNYLLYKKGEYYYSKFHIHTDGSDRSYTYIKPLEVFSSPTILNYSLRYKRLFYYFVGSTLLGQWHAVSIENLYRNNFRKDDNVGIDYFYSLKEVKTALIQLVSDGLIEIELAYKDKQISKPILLSNNVNKTELENIFNSYYDFKRTSLQKCKKRLLRVRVARNHVKNSLQINASYEEFIRAAADRYIAWEKINRTNINYFIGYKNELYLAAGETGLRIYRKALKAYLQNESINILYFDQRKKLANYFMDYYLLKEIKKILTALAVQQKYMKNAFQKTYDQQWKFNLCNAYELSFRETRNIINFFIKHASPEQKTLLDEKLYKNKVENHNILFHQDEWIELFNTVKEEELALRKIVNPNPKNPYFYFSEEDWRVLNHDWAKIKMSGTKKEFLELVEQHSKKRRVRKVPLYNWLKERD